MPSPAPRRTRQRPSTVPDEIVADSYVVVTSSIFGKEESERTTLEVRRFLTEPAYVRIGAGTTKNMGNYESLRLDVAVTVPCYVEEIDATAQTVGDYVAAKLQQELEQY